MIVTTKQAPSDELVAKAKACLDIDRTVALWYGDPGAGKTTDMLTLANHGIVVGFDPEKRLKKSALKRRGIDVANVQLHTGPHNYGSCRDYIAKVAERVENGEPIVGFAWDAITESQKLFLMASVDSGVKTAEAKGMERNEWRTFQEDYGDVAEQIRRLIRQIRDMPIHIGMTALAKRDQDEEGAVRVTASVTPALLKDVQAAMDFIIFKKVEEVAGTEEYFGVCRPTGKFDAKDAYGVLPRRLVDPTFERILGYVSEELTPKSDAVQRAAAERRRNGAAESSADPADKKEN